MSEINLQKENQLEKCTTIICFDFSNMVHLYYDIFFFIFYIILNGIFSQKHAFISCFPSKSL